MKDWEVKRNARRVRQEEISRQRRIQRMKVFAVVLSVLAFAAMGFSVLPARQPAVEHTVIAVKPGDTLWGIASEHPVGSMPTEEVVDYIKKVNHLDSEELEPGDSLEVPQSS